MAYTEKVSVNGTALSFLLYECINSSHSQEGFLIGDVTSEITNHISDSQSDNARLDTQIIIRTVLPLPSVSLFYLPTGRIKEDVVKELLSDTAAEVVGWYKFRKNNSIKPTFRDKLISKGLQKFFEKCYGRKHFVLCNLSNRQSSSSSTHTLTYRFGKINCFDMYEYIEDVTANLGEKLTGYRKPNRLPAHGVFNKIIEESGVQGNDAILYIQEAVDIRLKREAKIAAKNENIIRELEAEIKQMTTILSEKQAVDLQSAQDKLIEEKLKNNEADMAKDYVSAIKKSGSAIFNISYTMMNSNNLSDSENSCQIIENIAKEEGSKSPSPVLVTTSTTKKSTINYANALKNSLDTASTSSNYTEDLITFDLEEKPVKNTANNITEIKSVGDSSPEY